MIRTQEDFETALEEAVGLFEHPPHDSAEGQRLMDLMRDIAAYRPQIVTPDGDPVSRESAALAKHLKQFEAGMPKRYSDHWHTLVSEI